MWSCAMSSSWAVREEWAAAVKENWAAADLTSLSQGLGALKSVGALKTVGDKLSEQSKKVPDNVIGECISGCRHAPRDGLPRCPFVRAGCAQSMFCCLVMCTRRDLGLLSVRFWPSGEFSFCRHNRSSHP